MRFPFVDFDPESFKPVEPPTDADLSSPNSAASIVTSAGAKYKLFAITVCFSCLQDRFRIKPKAEAKASNENIERNLSRKE